MAGGGEVRLSEETEEEVSEPHKIPLDQIVSWKEWKLHRADGKKTRDVNVVGQSHAKVKKIQLRSKGKWT